MSRLSGRRHEDRGASLILTLGFVVMIGAISSGLIGLTTSSLNNRDSLERVRNREYAADGAIEEAVAQVRQQVGPALVACTAASGSITDTLNATTIRVDWRNACAAVQSSDGTIVAQHDVVFTACENTGAACVEAAVIARAQVNFEQAASGAVTKAYVQSWSVNR
jgi:hypothetical protein